jgi:hypothetical protein
MDMLRCSFFDFGTGWIIAAMYQLGWVYPSLLWLPVENCPWVVALPWLGNGGGGAYAIDPCTSACFTLTASYSLKNVLQSRII